MKKLKTINFIKSHKHWKDLLQAPPYCLKISEDEHYAMLRYNQIESDFSQQICRECRGLVIDKHTLEPVALSFEKFFNYGEERAAQIDWKSARVQEKIDGSKILVFWNQYTKKWQIATSGCINAYLTKVGGFNFTFGELFEMALLHEPALTQRKLNVSDFFLFLQAGTCYSFELVSPFNKVVVNYPEPKLYLIGQRNTITWEEEEPMIWHLEDFPRPKKFSELESIEQCVAACDKMTMDEEGFVVVDKFWNRVKVKGKEYLQAHFAANNGVITDKRIFDILMQREESEFLSYFPEYKPRFDEIKMKIFGWQIDCRDAIENVLAQSFTDRKDMAQYINEHFADKSDIIFVFMDSIDKYLQNYLCKMTSTQRQKFFNL